VLSRLLSFSASQRPAYLASATAPDLQPEEKGWLGVGAVHHNLLRKAVDDDENLKDADDSERILGPRLNLVLHGHTHDAKLGRLGSGLPVLSTGSAAVQELARPAEVPNRYQIVQIRPGQIKRWARRYEPDEKRWVGDNRISTSGNDWRSESPERFAAVHGAFPDTGSART